MTKEQTFEHPPRGHVALLAYDSDNDRFQVVHVDANGLLQVDVVDQAANLDVNIAAQAIDVEVTQATPADLVVGDHGYDGAAWRKQPLVWGYTDRLAAAVTHTTIGAGTYTMVVFTVPAGYVYVVNATLSNNWTTQVNHRHMLSDGTTGFEIKFFTAQAASVWAVNDNVFYVLKAGDDYRVQFVAAADGDALYGRAWGYTMKVDM